MRSKAVAIAIALFALTISGWCASNTSSGFTSLKGLAGQWQTKDPAGKAQIVNWKVISAGSAVMETMEEESMVTMYHLDKERLLLMHYCSAQNQPRMQAEVSDDGKTFTFDFLDATNLASPSDGHMHKMVLTILDKDHFTEQWFFSKDGKDDEHGTFHFTRKK
ncbi:MAG: hypothetical protein WA738_13285 [Candidatus Angelobacter sp.]